MKNINCKVYSLILILTLSVFNSCREDYESEISDHQKGNVPEKVQLLEHSSQSITVAWDFIKNATSYTVQLVESIDSDLPIVYYTTSTEDYFEFSGLSKFGNYYARVRANFPNSETSEWVYVVNDEGNKARIIPHLGIVNEDYVLETITLLNSSSSTLTIAWSLSLYSEEANEYKNKYNVEIFADKECTNLVISWIIDNKFSAADPARFTFSGLDANRDYYVRVEDQTLSKTTTVFRFKTQPAIVSPVAKPSQKGDIILSQDFSKLVHGGDIAFVAYGYSVSTAIGRLEWSKAIGENPVDATLGQTIVTKGTEFNVFDGGNVTTSYTEGAGMKDWGKEGNTSTRPGYIKIGGGSAAAYLYTPELNSLSQATTVTARFKVAIYKEGDSKFCEDLVVRAVEGAIFNTKGAITNAASVNIIGEELISIEDADGKFVEKKVVLKNVTPNSRIVIGSNKAKASANKTRFLLDDIIISLENN